MKTKVFTISWLITICLLILSCASAESDLPVDLENNYVNKQIKLLVPDQFNSYKTTSSVVLQVQYYSENDIVFPNNYNVRIFKRTSSGWAEVQEQPTLRLPEDDIVFSAEKETTAIRLFTVDPELVNYAQSYELRFYILGDMKVDNEIKQVSAYADVKLDP